MNMARFANVAVGTGVENWDGGDHYLGFSRGNKAFVAMGNLNREFYTGLPDGEYCDIIHDCQQKIQVRRMHGNKKYFLLTLQISGGKGYFSPAQEDDPVVAICVGCN